MAFAWDARAYDAAPLPHVGWAAGVMHRLAPDGQERVLDAGCGTGRDLAAVLDAHSGVTGYGVDRDAAMLARAADRLERFGARAVLRRAELTEPLPVPPNDAIMSVAVLHWVDDDIRLFAALAGALRPGGRLAFECGGAGNIARVMRALREAGAAAHEDATRFREVDRAVAALRAAGFTVDGARLRPDPYVLPDRAALRGYLAAVIARPYLAARSPSEQQRLLDGTADRLPDLTIDYVRLEVEAHR